MVKIIKSILFTVFLAFITLAAAQDANALMVDQMTLNCQKEVPVKILEGDLYHQTFVSQADAFGIVAIKFANYQDISQDLLVFRIKELGADDWHFEYTYKVDQMQDNQYFTFGIPQISNAKDKAYVFELESISGQPDDSIGVFISTDDCLQEGTLTINGQESESDIVFKLVQGVPAQKKLYEDIFFHLSKDTGFFVFWTVAITTLAVLTKKS